MNVAPRKPRIIADESWANEKRPAGYFPDYKDGDMPFRV
jgi:hypothetical protein